ncbi:lipid A biosynthesis lauroyl acyltransferase [Chromobacterium haemolyticum]|uniref:Lipid A biosynthesis lauroyl acyltransferase n=1 Tax=Chromobacterium haemolyticum TaxID=394935 RepID=A0ABS3GRQ7_9NEIS|nr:lipid A biosynthesis lauroyl acyltransferase [Chromobacterium haemolyticum]MBK0416407.1 lipid A biosynthesis lauroyl acyltransferase [Chromobacterium haemolyticum]MBO0417639.1 lipid A biosynthesis lauroyl acyltransferase [Chromobacterium haemolyticum]MBO0500831.1 lipid A biosynthesis lauroyl acyltransferase [Chromobacterium haemolyticum]
MKFAFSLLWLIRLLPMWAIGLLARGLGNIAYCLAHGRRRVGMINLRLCFPDMPLAERRRLIRRNFQHMIRMVLEYGVVWWSSAARIDKLVKIKNLHYVTELRERGEDVILFYPHFVGFEMCVYSLNQHIPLVSVYSHQKNEALDRQIYKGRQRYDNAYIVSRQEGLRPIIKAMRKDHAPFLYLPDQDFGVRDSVFVDFFGVKAATITGLSRISKLACAKVVPAIARRVGNRFELEFYPPWDDYPSEDVEADTRRMNAFLEQRVREIPDQYFWLHKRFKSRPQGEARFY